MEKRASEDERWLDGITDAMHLNLGKLWDAVQGSGLTAPCAVGLWFAFTCFRRVWEALLGKEAAPGHARLLSDLPLWV